MNELVILVTREMMTMMTEGREDSICSLLELSIVGGNIYQKMRSFIIYVPKHSWSDDSRATFVSFDINF